MPNIKSATKRVETSAKRRNDNIKVKGAMKTAMKKVAKTNDATDLKVHENISNLQEQKLSLHNKLLSCKTDIDILMNQSKNLTEEIFIVSEKIKKNNTIKINLQNEVFNYQKEIAGLEYKIKSLEDYITTGGSINSNVKRLFSNPKLKGLHNTISNLIDIDSKYATALDIALGGSKDYVVVDDSYAAKNCINYLKENNLGRVTFYPLDAIKSKYIDDQILNLLEKEPGFINILANLVKFDDDYHNIIYNRLGNVLLVDNIDNANFISKKIQNKFMIVTLTGELINVGGSITGGTIKQRSVISEKYELQNVIINKENVIKESHQIEEKLENYNKEIQIMQNSLLEKEKSRILLTEEINNKNINYEEIKKVYEQKDLELNNLEDLISENISKEEERITKQYYDVLNQKEEISKKLIIVNKEKEKTETEIEELQASYKLSNSNIRDKEANLKDLEINNTKMSVKMDNLLNTLSETYEMTFESAKTNYILEIDADIARKNVNDYKKQLKDIGIVNIGSIEEYDRINKRYIFLTKQSEDLDNAIKTLLSIIDELDVVMKNEFLKTFKEIEIEFDKVFRDLFNGGSANLSLTDANNILETGVEINVIPPGKKISTISLLSGGEKTLTAISLLFAILNIKKVPFCLFDEIEAALDEANVSKVGQYFSKYVDKTQLIIITHKKKTMEYANTLYGITMQESGVSKLVSVKLVD